MKKTRIVKINTFSIIIVVFIFALIILKTFLIALGTVEVNGVSLMEFADERNTKKEIINAERGVIYSSNGEILAKDVNSYTVIAYLNPDRTTDPDNPHHVLDKVLTAKSLSPLINMTEERILDILNTKIESCENGVCNEITPYQVELGPGGRGITELVKDQIEDLGLPGIDFISSTKRYYPNGDFLSYTLGYARKDEDGVFNGEMGLELSMNDELTGIPGIKEYQADVYGYQITNSPTVYDDAKSGNDVYLTIDTNIQMFTEQAMSILENGKLEWATLVVTDAKTGKILGLASSPSFNNNTLDIKSYYDPFLSYEYEPGSVMKIFSFMAAMENGLYKGEDTFKSGSMKIDDFTVRDWNKYGWGTITYDEGFMASSNVAASNLGLSVGRAKLRDFYSSLGFGEVVKMNLPNEMDGNINFRYNSEIAAASYGQSVTVTAAQMIQALTSLANDGIMVKPYLIEKVVDHETGEILKEYKREEVRKVASKETTEKLISIMRGVVDGTARMSTGTSYYMEGYDLIGKTGTAEIASSSGGYLENTYVRSFAGVFPGNDPQIIVYAVASKMQNSTYIPQAVKSLIQDVSTYLNIYNDSSKDDTNIYTLKSYINKNVASVKEELNKKALTPIVIGDGDRIIKQYPENATKLNVGSKVFLLTNGKNYLMPDISKWSLNDTKILCDMIGMNCTFEGYGYVKEYNIKKDERINSESNININIKLETKYINSE